MKKNSSQKWSLVLALLLFFCQGIAGFAGTTLNGSGATFPAPLYMRWSSEFQKSHPQICVNYQGIGSGAGIVNFTKGLTDFCASDIAMTDAEVAKNHDGVVMIPLTAGMIVLSYNITDAKTQKPLTSLKLTREAYTGIFLGKITRWNDPLLVASNPEVALPSSPITVVARSDGSGTTALFTDHLTAISPEFDHQVGSGKSVKWPVGLAGKGNDGVTSLIKGTPGSIGYIEYGFAKNNHLPAAELQNKAGTLVTPSDETGTAALASIVLPENLRSFTPDPTGVQDYPISGFTWVILKKNYPLEKSNALKEFLTYALNEGQSLSSSLGYLPLPLTVREKSLRALAQVEGH